MAKQLPLRNNVELLSLLARGLLAVLFILGDTQAYSTRGGWKNKAMIWNAGKYFYNYINNIESIVGNMQTTKGARRITRR